MESISYEVNKLMEIDADLIRVRRRLRELNAEKKKLESIIAAYLTKHGSNGVQCGKFIIRREVKTVRYGAPRGKARERASRAALKRHMGNEEEAARAYEELQEVTMGKRKEEVKLVRKADKR